MSKDQDHEEFVRLRNQSIQEDMSAFVRIPQAFGLAAVRSIERHRFARLARERRMSRRSFRLRRVEI